MSLFIAECNASSYDVYAYLTPTTCIYTRVEHHVKYRTCITTFDINYLHPQISPSLPLRVRCPVVLSSRIGLRFDLLMVGAHDLISQSALFHATLLFYMQLADELPVWKLRECTFLTLWSTSSLDAMVRVSRFTVDCIALECTVWSFSVWRLLTLHVLLQDEECTKKSQRWFGVTFFLFGIAWYQQYTISI